MFKNIDITINTQHCCGNRWHLRTINKRKCPGMLTRCVFVQHDNDHPHVAALSRIRCAYALQEVAPSAHSLYLSPCDFHVFGTLQEALKLLLQWDGDTRTILMASTLQEGVSLQWATPSLTHTHTHTDTHTHHKANLHICTYVHTHKVYKTYFVVDS
jgi:hypothetical protein